MTKSTTTSGCSNSNGNQGNTGGSQHSGNQCSNDHGNQNTTSNQHSAQGNDCNTQAGNHGNQGGNSGGSGNQGGSSDHGHQDGGSQHAGNQGSDCVPCDYGDSHGALIAVNLDVDISADVGGGSLLCGDLLDVTLAATLDIGHDFVSV